MGARRRRSIKALLATALGCHASARQTCAVRPAPLPLCNLINCDCKPRQSTGLAPWHRRKSMGPAPVFPLKTPQNPPCASALGRGARALAAAAPAALRKAAIQALLHRIQGDPCALGLAAARRCGAPTVRRPFLVQRGDSPHDRRSNNAGIPGPPTRWARQRQHPSCTLHHQIPQSQAPLCAHAHGV